MDHVELCRAIWRQKAVVDNVKEKLEAEVSHLEALKADAIKSLDSLELTKQHLPGVGTAYIQTKFSVTVPKTPEAKVELFDYIREKKGPDVLLGLQTINSQSLNSFYDAESTLAAEAGNFRWALPGVGEPKAYKTLNLRKG